MRYLYLDGVAATDRSVEHIRAFKDHATLWLSWTSVSREAVERLKQDRPGLTVYGP